MLDAPTLTLIVAYVVQFGLKPLLAWYHGDRGATPNNLIRAGVGVVAYALVLCNTAVAHMVDWRMAWSLLPQAGAIAGAAIATYHILTSDALPDLGGTVARISWPTITTGTNSTTTATPDRPKE